MDQNDRFFFLTGVVLPVFMSRQALHHHRLIEGHSATQRSSFWDVRHCDSVVLDILPPSVPLSDPPPPRSHVIARAASPSSLVLPESYSLCLKPLRNTLNSQRLSLARGVVFSVVKHERHVLSSSVTSAPSHTCYWLLLYNLNQIWNFYDFQTCGNPKYVKLLHECCVYFWAYFWERISNQIWWVSA